MSARGETFEIVVIEGIETRVELPPGWKTKLDPEKTIHFGFPFFVLLALLPFLPPCVASAQPSSQLSLASSDAIQPTLAGILYTQGFPSSRRPPHEHAHAVARALFD